MSRTIHASAVRMLAGAGFLGVASLIAPVAILAQTITPERALLNTTAVVFYSGVTVAAGSWHTLDGEWALLARSTSGVSSQPTLATGSPREAQSVDGEQALLGKGATSEARRLMLAL